MTEHYLSNIEFPNLYDFTNQLYETKTYSVLDIDQAYHHIPATSEDITKTAITAPFGLFEFQRINFAVRKPDFPEIYESFIQGTFLRFHLPGRHFES